MYQNIRELKEHISIVDIVGRFLKIKKVGNAEKALCPFHNEKTESFTIHKSKNGYKCFGCGKSGNAIDFIMDYQKVGFLEAVQIAADLSGFKLEEDSKVVAKPLPRLEKLSKEFLENFENKRKISNDTLLRFGITESTEWMPKAQKEIKVICFNYFKNGELVNIKYRGKDKDMRLNKDSELIFYNLDAIKDSEEVVITEGEIDCLSLHEAGIFNVVSVPNGANSNFNYIDNSYDFLINKNKIIIAVDNDKAGLKLREELINRFGKEKCFVVDFPNGENYCKDSNDYLVMFGKEKLKELILSAKQINIDGLIPIDERKDALFNLYKNGVPTGTKTGIYGLDDYWRPQLGLVTVITGAPGCFTKEQLVHTEKGVKPISEINIGENVLCYNHSRKINEYRIVTNKLIHETHKDKLYRIKLKDGTIIKVTENHEFFTGTDYVKIKEILLSLKNETMESNT